MTEGSWIRHSRFVEDKGMQCGFACSVSSLGDSVPTNQTNGSELSDRILKKRVFPLTYVPEGKMHERTKLTVWT